MLVKPRHASEISIFLNRFKSYSAHKINNLLKKDGPFWKEGTYDHIIRDMNDFQRHYDYIHFNPVKHGYVERPEDYKYSSYKQALNKNYY